MIEFEISSISCFLVPFDGFLNFDRLQQVGHNLAECGVIADTSYTGVHRRGNSERFDDSRMNAGEPLGFEFDCQFLSL